MHGENLNSVYNILNYERAFNAARTAYFSSLINNNIYNPTFLFNIESKLTQKPLMKMIF